VQCPHGASCALGGAAWQALPDWFKFADPTAPPRQCLATDVCKQVMYT
jgi:hypothetical protein